MVFVSLTSFIIGGTNLRSKEVILTHFNKVFVSLTACGETRFLYLRHAPSLKCFSGWVPSEFTFASRGTYAQPSHISLIVAFAPAFLHPYLRPYASICVDICAKKVAKFLQISENIPSKLAYVRFL